MIQQIDFPALFKNRHMQTILPFVLPAKISSGPFEVKKVFAKLQDGAVLVSYSHTHQNFEKKKGHILLVHGMEGSVDSKYILRFADHALKQGFNITRMNLRGCGESLFFNPLPYHAGLWTDVLAVCREIKTEEKLFVVGFSLGGNLVLKMAGELGEKISDFVAGIVSISGAIDMTATEAWLRKNPLYQAYLLWYLLKSYKKRCSVYPGFFRGLLPRRPGTLFEFDDRVTARLHGFQGAEQYYELAGAGPVLRDVRIPTMALYAQDDPMVPPEPYETYRDVFQANKNLHLLQTSHGGHVGFVGPRIFESWAIHASLKFIESQRGTE